MVSAVKQARDAGLVVIALDTPLEPITAADATFATDNFVAGELIGAWARATMGDGAATAKLGMLDIRVEQPTVGVLQIKVSCKDLGSIWVTRISGVMKQIHGS